MADDDFNFYSDVLGASDYDLNGKIDWNDAAIESDDLDSILGKTNNFYDDFDDCSDSDDDFCDDFDDCSDLDDDFCDDDNLENHNNELCNSINIPVKLSISFTTDNPEKTLPSGDIFKYVTTYDSWDFKKALLDNFPALYEDFDEESPHKIMDMFDDIFWFEPDKGVEYLKWLLHFFNPDEMRKVDFDTEEDITILCVNIINRLCDSLTLRYDDHNNKKKYAKSKYLYDFITTDTIVDEYFFEKSIWEKHDLFPLKSYIEFFVAFGDYERIMNAYQKYLSCQQDKYNNNDLYHFWDIIISWIGWNAKTCTKQFYNFVLDAIEPLGKYSEELRDTANSEIKNKFKLK